jgi:hypothetical protein
MARLTTLERAFELAQSGQCATYNDLRKRLKSEGYSDSTEQLSFPALRKQLTKLIQEHPATSPAA